MLGYYARNNSTALLYYTGIDFLWHTSPSQIACSNVGGVRPAAKASMSCMLGSLSIVLPETQLLIGDDKIALARYACYQNL